MVNTVHKGENKYNDNNNNNNNNVALTICAIAMYGSLSPQTNYFSLFNSVSILRVPK